MTFASGLPLTDKERVTLQPERRAAPWPAKRRKAYEITPSPQSKARDNAIMGENDKAD